MSWQAYVDTSLVSSGQVDKGAIFSAAGDSVWAATPGFNISPEEIKAIIGAYTDATNVQSNGFHVHGVRYVYVSSDDRTLTGRGKDKDGVIVVKTKQAIVVAHYPSAVQPGAARKTVEALGDYLIGVGY